MRILGVICLLLALSGCSSLLFYPEPGQLFTPEKAGLEYRDVTLTTADGLRLHAWWLPAKQGVEVKGTVLHLHGNGGNLPCTWVAAVGCRNMVTKCCWWTIAVTACPKASQACRRSTRTSTPHSNGLTRPRRSRGNR